MLQAERQRNQGAAIEDSVQRRRVHRACWSSAVRGRASRLHFLRFHMETCLAHLCIGLSMWWTRGALCKPRQPALLPPQRRCNKRPIQQDRSQYGRNRRTCWSTAVRGCASGLYILRFHLGTGRPRHRDRLPMWWTGRALRWREPALLPPGRDRDERSSE